MRNKEKRKAYQKAYCEFNKGKAKLRKKIWCEANKEKYKAYQKSYREIHKEEIKAYQKIYSIVSKDKLKDYREAYGEANKDKLKAYHKVYREANKEKILAYYKANKEKINASRKLWYKAKSEKINAYMRAYNKRRYKSNPKFRLGANISLSMRLSLKGQKNGRHWEILVGFTLDELKKHLEKQFTYGMAWNNYGEWHIDHKIPIVVFNFTKPEHTDFKKCWALKNLQPMWARENISKKDKLTKHFQPSLLI